ncbi:hypothetical protein PIB30_004984 [Stylosanthes scabra]|uniref:Phosphoinositide phospholipase C n=1 Tax=Stylosanthes scabra TaxID=79078 RepID=A0ABU6X3G5_9FABA|nr:hypothetical protein [Stylosanthes scabra]
MTTHKYKYKTFSCFNKTFTNAEPGPPPDVIHAFHSFSSPGATSMSADNLLRFLTDHQRDRHCTSDDALHIIQSLKGDHKTDDGLTLDDFFHFLLRDDLNPPLKSEVHHDMNAPLSHYFIFTGHNSYLIGNQLTSDCSDVPIVAALVRGVRVIELDLWPNSTKDDVEVFHGRTLTSPISLRQCLWSIKEHAFDTSAYPVIITFEDHLTPDLQAVVAEMVTEIFGEMLYYPETDVLSEFPSPESLKGRILISTKPPIECLEDKETDEKGVEDMNASDENSYKQSAPTYTRLITIHAGKSKGDFKEDLKVEGKVKRLSLSESKLEKASESYGPDIVRFTQKNMLRVYPKGIRITSSNYKPQVAWTHGAQMVAFNMQGHGKSLWFMQGLFKANGGCGYVKKPDFLVEKGPNNEVFDPKRTLPVNKTLKVKAYLGIGWSTDFSLTDFDSNSPPDFYIKMDIAGVPADKGKKKTKTIKNNWFPVWEEEFDFALSVPDLAMLRIQVKEEDRTEKDDFAGQTCLPISELKPGLRSIPLYDAKGEKYKSVRLLMRFQLK